MTSEELRCLNKSKKSTEDSIDGLGKWMIAFTSLVVTGLVIEYGRPFVSFLKTCDWKILRDSIGGALVTGGVAGELFVEYRAHRKEQTLRKLNASIDTEAAARLKAADERIAEANRAAAEANARAAEANQEAQEAVLELARLTAPRALTQEQRDRIVDKLRNCSGTEYDISVSPSIDPEILDFAFIVELILSTAGWIELNWQGDPGAHVLNRIGHPLINVSASVTDVVIGVHDNQPPKLLDCAITIATALAGC